MIGSNNELSNKKISSWFNSFKLLTIFDNTCSKQTKNEKIEYYF